MKQNSNKMENKTESIPTEVIIPITEIKKIIDVINSILPMFIYDPYKVFRDAEKEGKVIQIQTGDNKWVTKEQQGLKHWSYTSPPEKYRIKHKHQDLIDEWEANKEGIILEYYNEMTKLWEKATTPSWKESIKYRIRPILSPLKDLSTLVGKVIVHKQTKDRYLVLSFRDYDNTIRVGNCVKTKDDLLKFYTYVDGSPICEPIK